MPDGFSMRQKIDIGGLHADALRRLKAEAPNTHCPADNLDDQLTGNLDVLLTRLPPAA
jgi:hypothetical protein